MLALRALLTLCLSASPFLYADEVDRPLAPEVAASTMEVPEGFRVTLFAGEPNVVQPINFCVDDRGRLWVCEAVNYPEHGLTPGDRIIIFEDTDNDGTFDKRTVFHDQLNYVTGIEVGFGGAWVMSPPYLYFIPDKNGDDVPDGDPEVILDGFGNHANSHNLANGFAWGPDGWLYATHGRTNWSLIGKPGTPEEDRIRFDGGVWRMDPVSREWEPWCDGTTNPWGIDWNEFGQAFITNCVNPHLFHAIPGAHYEPWRGRQSSQYAYQRIETIADHLHYVEGDSLKEQVGDEETLDLGGGHAHCGVLIYQGTSFPDKYRNNVFLNNIHGKRINYDILAPHGSGYTASHGKDLAISNDPWFMGVTLQAAPDGSVYVIDWSDTGECHSTKNTRKTTGRIFKISYGSPDRPDLDWDSKTPTDLAKLHTSRNAWLVRHARRILQERNTAGIDSGKAKSELHGIFETNPDVPTKLRAMWTLHTIDGIDDAFHLEAFQHDSEHIRAWAVRLSAESRSPSPAVLDAFVELADSDPSPSVRLEIASALQRLPTSEVKWEILTALARHVEDSSDHNLPHMIWYAGEPMIHEGVDRFLEWGSNAAIPQVSKHVARRVAEFTSTEDRFEKLVNFTPPPSKQDSCLAFLDGILEGLEGTPEVQQPTQWPALFSQLDQSGNREIRESATRLALKFNDPVALKILQETVRSSIAPVNERKRALAALASYGGDSVAPSIIEAFADAALQQEAIRSMSTLNGPEIPQLLLSSFPDLPTGAKQDALQTLASRPEWGKLLLDAVEKKDIPLSAISTYTARQLKELGDTSIAERVDSLWGSLRKLPAEKEKLLSEYRKKLTPELIKNSDPSQGRGHFQKLCLACHQMFGEGGTVGPELTGSQRTNLDYLLENLIDPSAAVSKDYQLEIIETDSGRVVAGVVFSETGSTLKIRSINEEVALPISSIKKRTRSPVSMMPEGLLTILSTEEALELIAYLSSPQQVALPQP